MSVCVSLYRYWIKIANALLIAASSTTVSASTLSINALPLQLHISDASIQRNIEQNLAPLVTKLNAVVHELELLNQQGVLDAPSEELIELLQLCERWQTQLHNNFSCRLGALQGDWDAAVIQKELPDRALLRQKARHHLTLQWQIDESSVRYSDAARAEGLQLDLHGLWHGWVLEQVANELEKISPQKPGSISDFKLVYGHLTLARNQSAAIGLQVVLGGLPSLSVPLNNQTIAVLDRQQHLRKVAHYPMSRLLVPKEGWPVEFSPSLLVRASNAIEAGVLVQSLLNVSVHDALVQVNKMTRVTALAITETGVFFASKDWYGGTDAASPPWQGQQTFSIDYEIPALDVAEYRRPYMAIWISDEQGNSVRQLQLLGENRWLRDLRLWWRKFGRADDSLVDALAGATQKPGRYRIDWDGRDGYGNNVPQGKYELHLEVVREHGEREAIQIPFELNGQVITADAKGAREIGRVRLGLQ